MTREEEIEIVALNLFEQVRISNLLDFEEGAKWADEHPKSPWISVEDRLPEEDGKSNTSIVVYIKDERGLSTSAWYDFDTKTWHIFIGFMNVGDDDDDTYEGTVTHWMQIPELSKGE